MTKKKEDEESEDWIYIVKDLDEAIERAVLFVKEAKSLRDKEEEKEVKHERRKR